MAGGDARSKPASTSVSSVGSIPINNNIGHIGDKKEGVGGGGEVLAQAGLEGGTEMFDGVEVGRVGRQNSPWQPAASTNLGDVGN
jgi:hypothetical protein